MQIDGKKHRLGSYDDEADAARAFDRVARVLGRPLNFPEENESEIVGPRSEGADQAVAAAVEAAKTFSGTDKAKKAAERAAEVHSNKKLRASHGLSEYLTTTLTILDQTGSSEYIGVYPHYNKWLSRIWVSRGSDNIG